MVFLILSNNNSYSNSSLKPIVSQTPKHHLPDYENKYSREECIDKCQFIVGGDFYNLPENKVLDFLNKYSNAIPYNGIKHDKLKEIIKVYYFKGELYNVSYDREENFLLAYTDAKHLGYEYYQKRR